MKKTDLYPTKTKKQKLAGSYLLQAYFDFNYERFLSIVKSTRYKVVREIDTNNIFLSFAINDFDFTKES